MFKKAKQYDFLKLVKWIGLLLLLIIFTSLIICVYAISAISNETSKYADSVVLSYVRETQQLLKNTDNTMTAEIMYDSNLDTLQIYQSDIKSIKASKTVKKLLESWAHQNVFPINYMIYFEKTELALTGSSTDYEYVQWRTIKDDMIKVVTKNLAYKEYSKVNDWNIIEIQGESYIIKYYNYNERYICSWIKISDLIETMVMEGLGKQCYFVLTDANGLPHNNQEILEQDKISLPIGTDKKLVIKGVFSKKIIISEPVKGTSFYLNAIINDYSGIVNILRVQILFIVLFGIIAIMCLSVVLYIRRTVIKPIYDFAENIKKLRMDNSYTVETHYQLNELKNASEALANLVNQINGLKIDIYERTLEQQKIKLDFLSVQIKPHFFLNCLNTIYHMVQIGKYKETQYLTQCVSDYMRYILKSRENLVMLGEELEHIKKYLEIQKIRYKEAFEAKFLISEEVLEERIPPLIIQTFVENALNHTIDWEADITIVLEAKKIQYHGEPYLLITIEDSGEGFEEEILSKLQNHIDLSEGERRIGIMNAIQRLHLQYGEKATISFYNCKAGGAGVQIQIPCTDLCVC